MNQRRRPERLLGEGEPAGRLPARDPRGLLDAGRLAADRDHERRHHHEREQGELPAEHEEEDGEDERPAQVGEDPERPTVDQALDPLDVTREMRELVADAAAAE